MASCDAGHGCTISCDNGCGAVYTEPNGPCDTFCSDSKKPLEIADNATVTIVVNDLPAQHAARIFAKLLGEEKSKTLAASSAHISFKLNSAKPRHIREAIEKHLHSGK